MDARNGIMDFREDHGADIPTHIRPRFRELSASPSPVDQIVGVGELIFANMDQLPNSALDLGAGLIAFATINAWHGLLEDDRGNAIVANLRKKMGEIKNAPAAPDPKPGYRIEEPSDDQPAQPVPTPPNPDTAAS
jgi:hypothetical protein